MAWKFLNFSIVIITNICKHQLLMLVLCFQSYQRVSQQLHTVSQVVVGAAIGSIFSILWYWLWNGYMLDAFVSSLWVRIIVVLGSAGLCIGFVLSPINKQSDSEIQSRQFSLVHTYIMVIRTLTLY